MTDWKIKGKAALVIVHMQEGIMGSLSEISTAKEAEALDPLPRQQALLNAFRKRNLPVIYVNVDFSRIPEGSILGYGIQSRRKKSAAENPQKMEVITELAPRPGEPVLTNWIWGAFTNSGLEQELRSRGVETLVIFGGALQIAVYNATVQASDLWYSVIIPEDACVPTKKACVTPQLKKIREVFVEEMFPRYALVTTTEDILAHLQ